MKLVSGDDWIMVSNRDSNKCHPLCQYMDLKMFRPLPSIIRIGRFCHKYGRTLNDFELGEDIFPQRTFRCKLKFKTLEMKA